MSESKFERGDNDNVFPTSYDRDLNRAEKARNSQKNDTNPYIQKEGFLGMDDIDRMRRKNIDKWY